MQPDEDVLPGLPGWPRDGETPTTAIPAPRESTVLPAVRAEARVGPPPWAGLPNLSDPRGTLPTAGAVTQAPARVRLTQEPESLTTQIRTMQPPDVARQVSSELGVLASELEALPPLL